jgi:AcrR family transcriptional regulator
MADAVAEKGFAWVTVADVISRAGVSRETFYEHFSDKEECFIAVLDQGARVLHEILGSVVSAEVDDPVEQLDRVLKAYLNTLAGEPAFAKAFLIDAYGAGPRATERRIELQRRFIDLVAEIFDSTDPDSVGRFACEALVASISSMVTVRVGSGRLDELPALREPIIALVRRYSSDRPTGARSSVTP